MLNLFPLVLVEKLNLNVYGLLEICQSQISNIFTELYIAIPQEVSLQTHDNHKMIEVSKSWFSFKVSKTHIN